MNEMTVRLDHIRLDVADIDAAERFYAEALGLRTVVRYDLGRRVILQMAPEGLPAGVELWWEDGLVPVRTPPSMSPSRSAMCPGWSGRCVRSATGY